MFPGALWVMLPCLPFSRSLTRFMSSQKSSRACWMRMAAVCMLTCALAKFEPSSARPETMIPLIPPAERISALTSRYLSSENISLRSGCTTSALHRWFVVASAEPVIARRNRLFTALSWVMSGMISDFGSP